MKFELRRNNDITILEAIVHIVTDCGEPVINTKVLELNEQNQEYMCIAIQKLLADGDSIKAKIFNWNAQVPSAVKRIFDELELANNSIDIVERFNRVMDQYELPSGNLLIIRLMVEDKPAVAILKLDYQISVENEVEVEEDGAVIDLQFRSNALPKSNQRPSAGAVILKEHEEYDLVGREQIFKAQDGEIVEYFFREVLQANRVVDSIDKTKLLHKQMEKWLRKHVKNQMDRAIGIREDLRDIFRNKVDISIKEVANDLIDDAEKREQFIEQLEVAGVDTEDKFELDKVYLEKILKNKTTKTDTGIVIKGHPDIFDDPSKFEVKYNGDGTVNYIIKNVRNISQA